MAVNLNLSVRADVIDINGDTPYKDDIFLVDTNIWLWYTYANSTTDLDAVRLAEINTYLDYLTEAASIGSTLTYSGLLLAELASVIERNEWKIFRRTNYKLELKEYRHNLPIERANVAMLVESGWNAVKDIAVPVDIIVNDAMTDAALKRFQSQTLDGYDLLHLEAISQAGTGQVKVMTDDCDYCTAPDIQLFTLNSNVIESAELQQKLVNRSHH
jgi:hypothetical protein